jgi:hypothetical protein
MPSHHRGSGIRAMRLHNQAIAAPATTDVAALVARFGAVQAQDYRGGLWALGLRIPGATEAEIECALDERRIVRSWPLRGTLHFTAAADLRWMLAHFAPRVLERERRRLRDEFGLDDAVFARARSVLEQALHGGRRLSRPALYELLESRGIASAGQRGIHVLGWLAQQGVICHAGRDGRQPAFALLEEWLPPAPSLSREQALAELASRYFTSRGPAGVADFTWWSGLAPAEARRALELARPGLQCDEIDGRVLWSAPVQGEIPHASSRVHLLPAWDEFAVAYKDRGDVLATELSKRAGNGIFSPVAVVDGRIDGTWKRSLERGAVSVVVKALSPWSKVIRKACIAAAVRYAAFLGVPLHAARIEDA